VYKLGKRERSYWSKRQKSSAWIHLYAWIHQAHWFSTSKMENSKENFFKWDSLRNNIE